MEMLPKHVNSSNLCTAGLGNTCSVSLPKLISQLAILRVLWIRYLIYLIAGAAATRWNSMNFKAEIYTDQLRDIFLKNKLNGTEMAVSARNSESTLRSFIFVVIEFKRSRINRIRDKKICISKDECISCKF